VHVGAEATARLTAEYKRKVLQEADACVESGQIGALLRREGLHPSHLVTWRHARERGELERVAPKKRGPKTQVRDFSPSFSASRRRPRSTRELGEYWLPLGMQ